MVKPKKQTQIQRIKVLEKAVINLSANLKRIHDNQNIIINSLNLKEEEE